jgi:two-component system response regulator MtrA
MSNTRILLVDDEDFMRSSLQEALTNAGYTVDEAATGEGALAYLARSRPSLLILDVLLDPQKQQLSGLDVCQQVRADPQYHAMPILILSGLSETAQIIEGLGCGADDYLCKPFNRSELLARVVALTRNFEGPSLHTQGAGWQVGDLFLHPSRFEMHLASKVIEITSTEHRLLRHLMEKPGVVFSYEELLQNIWDYPPGQGDENLVHRHIHNIRTKLQAVKPHNRALKTIHNQGYCVSTDST